MSEVLNRITKQFLTSANTPDYPVSEWIINPDMSAVENVDIGWWVIDGDTVREANESEKNASLEWYKSAIKLNGYDKLDAYLPDSNRIDGVFIKATIENNVPALEHIAPYNTWRDSAYSYMVSLSNSLDSAADIVAVDSLVSGFDLSQFDDSKPQVTYHSALGAYHGIG